MENAGGVGGRQRVCDLNRVVQRVAELQAAPPHHLRQRGTGKVLHRDEVDTLLLADVIDRDDVRMIQG